jgi:O-acetyl-ADP-ribose deacetylase (regulator of RNase III)
MLGELFIFTPTRDPWWKENGQYVIHFPTKKHWRDQSKLEYVEAGVKDFWRIFESLKIKFVAIPALGCGCGGLYWAVVKPVIVEWLRSVEGPIKVMLFEPELQKQQSCRKH